MTFFSGTDINTLREEGSEYNHFVSLIVNNAGTYCAAITRKIVTKITGNCISYYNSFNNVNIECPDPIPYATEEKHLEYFNLEVIKPEIIYEESELESRLKYLSNRKRNMTVPALPYNAQSSVANTPKAVQLDLFKDVVKESTEVEEVSNLDHISDDHLKILITGNIFAPMNSTLDVDKWINNMDKAYAKRFKNIDDFKQFIDSIVEILYNELFEEYIEIDGEYFESFIVPTWSKYIIANLSKNKDNEYVNYCIEALSRYEY